MKLSDIRNFNPCYDPAKWCEDENREFSVLEVLEHPEIEVKDKIWVATRNGILPDNILRKFTIYCARSCKTDIKEIKEYIDVIQKFYDGKATEKELIEADRAAYRAVNRAVSRAVNRAAYRVANRVANYAANCAIYCAIYCAAYCAADCAAYCAADNTFVVELVKLIKEA